MDIKQQLEKIAREKRMGIMTHAVAGYPDLETSELIIAEMAKEVDFIELQIPFSDPMADGPIIMAANQKALSSGIKVQDSFSLISKMQSKVEIPLLVMCYYNTIFNLGEKSFCELAKKSGVAGVIVPDLPLEEATNFLKLCQQNKLTNITIVAPNTPDQRLKLLGEKSAGFIYSVARLGVTGNKTTLDQKLEKYLKRVKKNIKLPLAVGFGIQKKEQIEKLRGKVELVIIGSALITQIQGLKGVAAAKKIRSFLQTLK